MKRLAYILVGVLGTLTLILVIWELRSIVLLFLVSLAIAAVLNGPIDYLMARGLSRTMALSIGYLLFIGGLLALGFAISGPLINELDMLTRDFIRLYERSSTGWSESVLARLPTVDAVAAFLAGAPGSSPVTGVLDVTQNAVNLIGQLLLAIVLSIYWSVDSQRFERLWLSLLEPEQRANARRNWRAVEANVGAYIRSELVQSVLTGALITLGLWVVNANYPFLTALVVALSWLVPLVGALLALVGVILLGLLSSPLIALFSLFYTILILMLMEFVIERYLYGQNGYSSVLVLLAMIAMADAFGLIGLLVAPPVALVLQVFWREFIEAHPNAPLMKPATDMHTIQDRLAQLHRDMETQEVSPRVTNLVKRLDGLMQEVEHTVSTPIQPKS